LFVNEVLTVQPGTQLEYLNLVASQRCDVMADHGIHATGLWEVINNAHEVVMVWATTVDDWVQFQKNRDTTKGLDDSGMVDERITEWEKTASTFITGGDTHIMTPLPGTVYGPDGWEEANLNDWLSEEAPAEYRTQNPIGNSEK
jgi:hypothetical protein